MQEEDQQRQDVFDPNGKVNWGMSKLSGFLAGQRTVPSENATEKEKKE